MQGAKGYDMSYKVKVVRWVREGKGTRAAAASHFGVNRETVSKWAKDKEVDKAIKSGLCP